MNLNLIQLTISDPELCEDERLVTGGLRCFLLNENDRGEPSGNHSTRARYLELSTVLLIVLVRPEPKIYETHLQK